MRTVRIAYFNAPQWLHRHVEAALLLATGAEDQSGVVLEYLASVSVVRLHGLAVTLDGRDVVLGFPGEHELVRISVEVQNEN